MQLSLRTLALSAVLCAVTMPLTKSQGVQRYTTELPVSCADYSEKLRLRVTYSEQASGNEGARPLIVFFAGFQCPSSWYNSYAEDLALNGSYVVLQYDTPRVLGVLKPDNTFLPDGIEVQFVPKLVSWIANEATNKSSPLFGRVDTSRIGLMGHSRGGKLAALVLASELGQPTCPSNSSTTSSSASSSSSGSSSGSGGSSEGAACTGSLDGTGTQEQQQQQQCNAGGAAPEAGVMHAQHETLEAQQMEGEGKKEGVPARGLGPQLAAVLIDPVDSGSGKLGESDSHRPSAVATLEGKDRSAAIIAAGINTWCNPINSTWSTFWPMLRTGWLQVVSKAGHMQFTNADGAWKNIFDTLCWAGDITHAETREFATRGALAWFGNQFDGKSPAPYIDWSKEQQHKGRALFESRTKGHQQYAST